MKKWIVFFLLLSMGLQLSACTQALASEDLMQGITANKVETLLPDAEFAAANAQFSLALLQNSYQEVENVVLSPYSALMALAMTANGAQGTTLSQMEETFGLPMGTLNRYLAGMTMGQELYSANSLWVREGFPVEQDFLQTNADYYGADIYRAKFDTQTTKDINAWVSKNTKDRIKNILDSIPPGSMLYLINALSFDAKWEKPYKEDDVGMYGFTGTDGKMQETLMLLSTEYLYLETEEASGFMKPYEGDRYYFFALLPDEDVPMQSFLQGLDGDTLSAILREPQHEKVITRTPKLRIGYAQSLKEALQTMGIKEAFTPSADFSAMSSEPLFIHNVTQKVYLELDECGTKAAAATIVDMELGCAADIVEPKRVYLTRPYVMGIYDADNQCIVFFGVINHVN